MLVFLKRTASEGFSLTRVVVHRGTNAITVFLRGDGPFRYMARPIDAQRLAIDFPGGQSLLRWQVLPVEHPLLDRIRIGGDSRRLRIVFDTGVRVRYAIRLRPQALAIQFRTSVGP